MKILLNLTNNKVSFFIKADYPDKLSEVVTLVFYRCYFTDDKH